MNRWASAVTDGHVNDWVKATVGKRDRIEIQGKMYYAFEVTHDMDDWKNIVEKSGNPQLKI